MRRTACSACGSAELHSFLNLGYSPIADAYTATADEESKLHPLEVAVCRECRLVQLLEVVDSETLFGTGYSFYSSASPPLSAYHRQYAEEVFDVLGPAHKDLVVEIGCNDGDMLRWFRSPARATVGVDPADGPAEMARARGLDVWKQEFTSSLARELRTTYGPADVIIANHVLAHVADVGDVLAGIGTLLAEDGVAFVEVQYLPDLLVNNAFDLVYHEHRNFFTLTSLEFAARARGLVVTDVRLTTRQLGSLRVTLRRYGPHLNHPAGTGRVDRLRASERWLNGDPHVYDGVQGRVDRIRTRLLDMLEFETRRRTHAGHTPVVAGYGAPAKATTLLNYCGITNSDVRFVVDTTVAKQGRFIPGTGIPIVTPGDSHALVPEVFLLLAWNYAHAIVKAHPQQTRWIVPIPAPMLL